MAVDCGVCERSYEGPGQSLDNLGQRIDTPLQGPSGLHYPPFAHIALLHFYEKGKGGNLSG
jgi:hypothetical protein